MMLADMGADVVRVDRAQAVTGNFDRPNLEILNRGRRSIGVDLKHFGGGGMLMAFGVACALVDAGRSGQGQVIDAAMVDGSAILMTMMWGFRALGIWGPFGTNVLDTGAPFYDTYETSDGKFISLGSL